MQLTTTSKHCDFTLSDQSRVLEKAFCRRNNKGLFGFRMRNKILRRSEKIETRSEKHDFSDRNSRTCLRNSVRITCSLSNTSSRSVASALSCDQWHQHVNKICLYRMKMKFCLEKSTFSFDLSQKVNNNVYTTS